MEDLIPPKAELIANLAGDNIWGERWWLVRLPSAGINNSSFNRNPCPFSTVLKVLFINNTVVHRYSICVLGKVLLLDQIGTDKRQIQPENY